MPPPRPAIPEAGPALGVVVLLSFGSPQASHAKHALASFVPDTSQRSIGEEHGAGPSAVDGFVCDVVVMVVGVSSEDGTAGFDSCPTGVGRSTSLRRHHPTRSAIRLTAWFIDSDASSAIASETSRIDRSRNSWGYFLGACMTPLVRSDHARKPGRPNPRTALYGVTFTRPADRVLGAQLISLSARSITSQLRHAEHPKQSRAQVP